MWKKSSFWVAVFAMTAVGFVAIWYLRPFLNRARETGGHIRCDMKMAQIDKAIQLYAADNQGHFPDKLTDLFVVDITSEVFCCPSAIDERATGATNAELTAQIEARGLPKGLHDPQPAAGTKRYCSYIYVGKGLTWPTDPKRVILYEPLSNHDGDGANVLFGDGHVEYIAKDRIDSVIQVPLK